MPRRFSALALTIASVVAIGLIPATASPALADSPTPSATATASPSSAPLKDCWVDVTSGQSLCVDPGQDLFAAVQAETGVQLLFPGQKPTLSDRAATPSTLSPDVVTVVSLLYEDINLGGSFFAISESVSTTCTGWTFSYASLSPYGWNDRVSSFNDYSNCLTTLYEDDNFGGDYYGPSAGTDTVGGLNDEASSVKVTT